MIIHPVTLREGDTHSILSLEIEYGDCKETLWYMVDTQYSPYLTVEKLDAFVVGLLPLAEGECKSEERYE